MEKMSWELLLAVMYFGMKILHLQYMQEVDYVDFQRISCRKLCLGFKTYLGIDRIRETKLEAESRKMTAISTRGCNEIFYGKSCKFGDNIPVESTAAVPYGGMFGEFRSYEERPSICIEENRIMENSVDREIPEFSLRQEIESCCRNETTTREYEVCPRETEELDGTNTIKAIDSPFEGSVLTIEKSLRRYHNLHRDQGPKAKCTCREYGNEFFYEAEENGQGGLCEGRLSLAAGEKQEELPLKDFDRVAVGQEKKYINPSATEISYKGNLSFNHGTPSLQGYYEANINAPLETLSFQLRSPYAESKKLEKLNLFLTDLSSISYSDQIQKIFDRLLKFLPLRNDNGDYIAERNVRGLAENARCKSRAHNTIRNDEDGTFSSKLFKQSEMLSLAIAMVMCCYLFHYLKKATEDRMKRFVDLSFAEAERLYQKGMERIDELSKDINERKVILEENISRVKQRTSELETHYHVKGETGFSEIAEFKEWLRSNYLELNQTRIDTKTLSWELEEVIKKNRMKSFQIYKAIMDDINEAYRIYEDVARFSDQVRFQYDDAVIQLKQCFLKKALRRKAMEHLSEFQRIRTDWLKNFPESEN